MVSFIFKRDSRAELYRPHLDGELLVVSFMTVAELDRWAMERDWGEPRRRRLEEHLGNFVVYPYNRQMCRIWAEISDEARSVGRPVGVADAWIAATPFSMKCRSSRTTANTSPASRASKSFPKLPESHYAN